MLKAIEREIYSCNKIIWLAQSDLTEKQQECNQLNVAISFLVSECHQLEFELLKAEEERRRINYETMMEMHAVRVGKQEKTLPLQKELECLCSHMEDLKMQSMCLCRFSTYYSRIHADSLSKSDFQNYCIRLL